MWGKPPFSIPDDYAIDVRNLTAAREWYKEKLGLHDSKTDREDNSRRPFVDLNISSSDELLLLAELALGAAVEGRHVIFFAKNRQSKPVAGGKRSRRRDCLGFEWESLLWFLDLDGDKIEVCI